MIIKEIKERDEVILNTLVSIWERAVRISHDFLTDNEILDIKNYVFIVIKEVPSLIVAFNGDLALGFIDVSNQK